MKRVFRILLIVLFIAFVAIQFIRPEKNNNGYQSVSSFEAETKPSAEVADILKTNCYDCHSEQTQYPWYAEIAPVSLWLANHVDHGKGHFNVSEWSAYSLKKKDHKLEEVIEMVEADEMPLNSYTWVHGKLTEAQKELLIQWAGLARLQYKNRLEVSVLD